MRYSNQICDGCEKLFAEDDEIVVCPECATPQHRECYNKNNRCVNYEKHGEDYTWQSSGELNTPASTEEKVKMIPCPNCGFENPAGSESCRQCSMKFTLFGFNVVDATAEEQEKTNPSSDVPKYEAPFTLGEGEGFDNQNEPEILAESEKAEEDSQQSCAQQTQPVFPGPFSPTDKTFGIPTNFLGAVLGQNAMKYIEKFKSLEAGKRISFNWAAFLFSPYWFFYRKLIKPGIIFSTVYMCLSIVATPSLMKFYELYLTIAENLSTATEAEFIAQLAELEALYPPVLFFMAAQFILHLICGFIADKMYKNHLVSAIYERHVSPLDRNSVIEVIRYGGVSPLFALMAILAENVISTIAGSMM